MASSSRQAVNPIPVRNSAFELIRIVAMSMIIIHHFMRHGISSDFNGTKIYYLLNPFVYCGVNLFFLISGWFTIKFSLKKLIAFVSLILIYDLFNCLLSAFTTHSYYHGLLLNNILFPISQSPYWFLQIYGFLMIISPLVNSGLKTIDTKTLRSLVALLTLGMIYSCNLGQNICNPNGYRFLQGLYLYIMGFYLYRDHKSLSKIKSVYLFLFYLLLLISGIIIKLYFNRYPFTHILRYNSYTILGSSICLFLILSRLKFYNKYVNLLGASALGCYLLQDGLFGNNFIYKYTQEMCAQHGIQETIWLFIALFFSFWIASLIVSPLFKQISGCITEYLSRLCRKLV